MTRSRGRPKKIPPRRPGAQTPQAARDERESVDTKCHAPAQLGCRAPAKPQPPPRECGEATRAKLPVPGLQPEPVNVGPCLWPEPTHCGRLISETALLQLETSEYKAQATRKLKRAAGPE